MHKSKILSFCNGFRTILAVDKSVYSYCLSALIITEFKLEYRHFLTYAVVPEVSAQVGFQNTFGQPVYWNCKLKHFVTWSAAT
jgi:hypothetical protein